jgi:hypothetical protein
MEFRTVNSVKKRGFPRVLATGVATLASVAALTVTTLAAPGAAASSEKPGRISGAVSPDVIAASCGEPSWNGKICYFYLSNYGGSQAGFSISMRDLSGYEFGPGVGYGIPVAFNAGSVHNRSEKCMVTIFPYALYSGTGLQLGRNTSHPRLNDRNGSHAFHNCL